MKREPMVFAVAGMVFGFVLGYMVASWDGGPRTPAATMPAAAAAVPIPGPAVAAAPGLDPNEVKALESLAAKDRTSVDARIQLGNLLMDHSRYGEAARWYREALALKPGQPDVLVDLGACLVNGGKAADGLVEFERALRQDPNHKNALFNKGIALMETGKAAEAVAVWEALLKRFPDDPQLQKLRGQIDRVKSRRAS